MLIEGIEIKEEDLCILSTASLSGFSFVKTTGIKLKHLPTGLEVECSSERSQHANRETALKRLALLLKEKQKQALQEKVIFKEGQVVLRRYGNYELDVTIVCAGDSFCCVEDTSARKSIVPTEELFLKPAKTIRIGGYDVPEPLREAPADGTLVYVVEIQPSLYNIEISFNSNYPHHVSLLKRGLLQRNFRAAILHAKALLSFTATELPSETNK